MLGFFCNIDADGIPFVFCCFDKIDKAVGIESGRDKNELLFFMFSFCNIDAGEIGRGRSGKEIVQNLLSPTDQFHIWGKKKALQNAAKIL